MEVLRDMEQYKQEFIEFMIDCNVLKFGDFVTKSGRNTPYFINTGNYRTGAQISRLGAFYADCIVDSGEQFDALFGPAYKGIPLSVAAASALYSNYGRDVPYFFNRKEAKDHGEGGSIIGYKPQKGDRIAIVEDVVTAGTAVRETLELFKGLGELEVGALFVSVDRCERGKGTLSALDELRTELGIKVYPIVTVHEVVGYLSQNEVGGRLYIDDTMKRRIEAYLAQYGA